MAYILHYWEEDGREPEAYAELRSVRLKSLEEAFPLALPHNRPLKTALVTVDRSDRQSEQELIVWDVLWETGRRATPSVPVVLRRGPGRQKHKR